MKNKIIENFFTSGWTFNEDESELKNRFQMMNIAFILSSAGLLFGITANILRNTPLLIPIEIVLLTANLIMIFALRRDKRYLDFVSMIVTLQFSFLFLLLVYTGKPEELKHIWIFTYPIVLLYFRDNKDAGLWITIMVFLLMIAPVQPWIHVKYSLFQITYISFVLVIVSIIISFYQKRMDEARSLIVKQKDMLKKQLEELSEKDSMLSTQSKQAVMGEMISMIAHQWRQPLSTVTLHISSLQLKRLLGKKIEITEVDKTLEEINSTIIYLSETIDDFQTYFHPKKEINKVEVEDLVQKAINFTKPRLKNTDIVIEYSIENQVVIETYTNEIIQVLLNILNNAVDALISRDITDPKIMVFIRDSGNELLLEIEDNAGGIDDEYMQTIFEPYFSTKGKNGTGLGLYMSQMIMQKQFHSSIEVKCQNAKTIFSLRVPKKLA